MGNDPMHGNDGRDRWEDGLQDEGAPLQDDGWRHLPDDPDDFVDFSDGFSYPYGQDDGAGRDTGAYRGEAPGQFSRRPQNGASGRGSGSNNYFNHNHNRGMRKAERAEARRKHNIVLAVVIALLAAGLIIGVVKIVGSLDASGNNIAPGQDVTINIPEGSSLGTISGLLAKAGVVDSASGFTGYVEGQNAESALKPGSYAFVTGSDYGTVLALLKSGPNASNTLTIPEGYTIDQTTAAVEATCGISADDFLSLCRSAGSYQTEYPFLAGAYDGSLEGYLFPKTYSVPQNATADDVVRMMLSQYQTEVASLDYSYPKSQGLSASDVVIMASLVEKECLYDQDRAHIAGVLYNRLSQGMKLQLDVTVAYALDGNSGKPVTEDDLGVDSPYNTYVVNGLPAGPICTPSLASLQAVCSPQATDDIYFILTKDYSHFYSNYDDFLAGKAEYEASL